MPKPSVYIETSIVGYLTANPSRDAVTLVRQQSTVKWWENYRSQFELFISLAVTEESGKGDVTMREKRLAVLNGVLSLEYNLEAKTLAEQLAEKILPPKANIDAVHIAIATVYRIEYLLTWNMKHIANVMIRKRIENFCREVGYEVPAICTPDEMLGE